MIIIMMDVDCSTLPLASRDNRCCFQAKTTLKLYPDEKENTMSNGTQAALHIFKLIIAEFHNQQSLTRCFTYTDCVNYLHIGYTVLPQVINSCLNLLQAQHNKCSVISWMTPQPLLFCQNWKHWHHVHSLSLFSHDVASPNVMYFPQQDTCNLGDSSAGSA